jgi:hypothetical protein
MPAVHEDGKVRARTSDRSQVRVPADPDPFERIMIDGEPWVWVPETARWVLEAVMPRRHRERLAGSGQVR